MAKYGLLDLVAVEQQRGFVYIRISKPLLRIVLAQRQVLSGICLSHECTESAAMPPRVTLLGLLNTCRDYYHDTQEVVQLVSWLISWYGWLLLESRPAATLASLRPGAQVQGSLLLCEWMESAARQVDLAGRGACAGTPPRTSEEKQAVAEARQRAAMLAAIRLVDRLPVKEAHQMQPGQAALFEVNTYSADSLVRLFNAHFYFLQSKGKESGRGSGEHGGDETVTPSDVEVIFRKMATLAERGARTEDDCPQGGGAGKPNFRAHYARRDFVSLGSCHGCNCCPLRSAARERWRRRSRCVRQLQRQLQVAMKICTRVATMLILAEIRAREVFFWFVCRFLGCTEFTAEFIK